MGQNIYVATLTLMDGTPIKVPILQITGYAEQFSYATDQLPPYTVNATFRSTIVMVSDKKEIEVQETASQVNAAIYGAINTGPP